MSSILDDLSRMRSIDRSHMLSNIQHLPEDLQVTIRSYQSSEAGTKNHAMPEKVIVAGQGGSSIAGDVISDWLLENVPIPIVVNRGLRLPKFADQNTLVIAISYSGETRETLDQFDEARSKRCLVHAVTSGGRLEELSRKHDIPITRVEAGIPPRAAFPRIFGAVSSILLEYGIIRDFGDIESAVDDLKALRQALDISGDTEGNPAKRMALRLVNRFPIIYSLERMRSTARRFKTQLNENSKVHSKFDTIPEICHNEVESWPELASDLWRCSFIFIRDDNQDEKESRIVQGTLEYLKNLGIKNISEIVGTGSNRLARLLTAIYMGDYVSVYLAIARGIDPTPIDGISKLKRTIW